MLEIIIAQLEEILREKGFQLDSEVPKDSKYLHFLMMVLTSLEMSQQWVHFLLINTYIYSSSCRASCSTSSTGPY